LPGTFHSRKRFHASIREARSGVGIANDVSYDQVLRDRAGPVIGSGYLMYQAEFNEGYKSLAGFTITFRHLRDEDVDSLIEAVV
jgi:hypothetical protein